VPFLRLTRDRRGIEHTFLLHADTPGERPRVLYWYRTAPGVLIGRPALDEEAIRGIEEQHPHIEFDWPAILALKEAMPPEEEPSAPARTGRRMRPARREGRPPAGFPAAEPAGAAPPAGVAEDVEPEVIPTTHGLLEELVGREIATRLRGRFAEMMARIREQGFDEATLEGWVTRAEALNPDTWLTPEAVLQGVGDADRRFDELRRALLAPPGA
jgi:hypothetical protein